MIKGPLAHAGFVCCHEEEEEGTLAWLIAGPFLIRRQPSKSSVSDFILFFSDPLNGREPSLLFRVLPCEEDKWWAGQRLMMSVIM